MTAKCKYGAEFHPTIDAVLYRLEDLEFRVQITDSARTFREHVATYKKNHPDNWVEVIPWASRHLPSWESEYCLAVDIKVWDGGRELTGEQIEALVVQLLIEYGVSYGIGVGAHFIHFDIRDKKARWVY